MASRRRGDHQAASRAAPWLLGTTQSTPYTASSCVARSVCTACTRTLNCSATTPGRLRVAHQVKGSTRHQQ